MHVTLAFQFRWVPWSTTLWLSGVAAVAGWVAHSVRNVAAGVLRELAIVLGLYTLWGFAGEHADSFYNQQGFMEGALCSGIDNAAALMLSAQKG